MEYGIKERKIVQRNAKIRDNRDKNTVGCYELPILVRDKPTKHEQYCYLCAEPFEKGDRQIIMKGSPIFHVVGHNTTNRLGKVKPHWSPVLQGRPTKLSGRLIFTERRYYLHPDCYGCMMNRTFQQAGLIGLVNSGSCENCRNRYNCLTGNYLPRPRLRDRIYERGDFAQ